MTSGWAVSPHEIAASLTLPQRATLAADAGVVMDVRDEHGGRVGESGAARRALAHKGLVSLGALVHQPGSACGFHRPREVTELGRAVLDVLQAAPI